MNGKPTLLAAAGSRAYERQREGVKPADLTEGSPLLKATPADILRLPLSPLIPPKAHSGNVLQITLSSSTKKFLTGRLVDRTNHFSFPVEPTKKIPSFLGVDFGSFGRSSERPEGRRL